MAKSMVDLSNLANGAVSERFNIELAKLLENIADPNTKAKEKRKMQLNITLEPNEERDIAEVSIQAKLTMAPAKEITTRIVMDDDGEGVVGAELKSGAKGQFYMDDHGEYRDDKGNVVSINK